MRILLSEHEIRQLLLGQVVEQIFGGGGSKIEVAMADIGFIRLHELVTEAQAAVQRRGVPGPAASPEGGDRVPRNPSMLWRQFRRRPMVVEALQWHASMGAIGPIEQRLSDGTLGISTLEGFMRIEDGDWVIRGVKGEFYPCKHDIFELTYEVVV